MNKDSVWNDDIRALSFFSQHGGQAEEIHIDLNFKIAVRILTRSGDSEPFKVAAQKDLSDAEYKSIMTAMEPLSLAEETAKSGPPPGGHSHFEVRYKTSGIRILAEEEGVSAGTRYLLMSEKEKDMLFAAIQGAIPNLK